MGIATINALTYLRRLQLHVLFQLVRLIWYGHLKVGCALASRSSTSAGSA